MNVISLNASLFLIYLICFGCSKPDIEQDTDSLSKSEIDTIDFRGETVIISKQFPKQLLNQSPDEFDLYYAAQNQQANSRTNASEDYLTHDELLAILQPLAKKYPDLSWEKDISETDLQRIYNDFPKIKTVEEVREKSDLILAFYNDIFKPEAVAAVVAYKKSHRNGRIESGLFGYIYPYEQSKVMSMPLFAPLYALSAATATSMANIYGKTEVGRRGDAFRHGAWNCLGMRNIIIAGAHKQVATEYMQKCATAHEREDEATDPKTCDAAMDLFNNLSARTWMFNSTSWGIGPNRIMPSEFHIRDKMKAWADNASWIFVDNFLQQIVIDNQGNAGNWGALYGACTGNFQHLMYYQN